MADEIVLTVFFEGKELEFPMRLLNYGNNYKLETTINETKVIFEPDEERNWRALISMEELEANKTIRKELLQCIAIAIDEALQ